jgi:hypothetical protein
LKTVKVFMTKNLSSSSVPSSAVTVFEMGDQKTAVEPHRPSGSLVGRRWTISPINFH